VRRVSEAPGVAGTDLARLQRRVASRYPNWLDYAGYGLFHAAALGVFWTDPAAADLGLFAISFAIAMTGATLCFHRYFAHNAFETSRRFQLLLAVWGTLSLEKGPLWWASQHRHHHRYADTPDDIHSPHHQGRLYAYMGWFLDRRIREAELSQCPRLAAYGELIWLTQYNFIPPAIYAAGIWLLFGWDGLIWGFFLSTLAVWHATHMISSLLHGPIGYRNFPTLDNSRNSLPLSLVLFGEGYHNNHHHAPYSARCGLRWWEFDLNWWLIRLFRRCGLIWNVRAVDPADLAATDGRARTLCRRLERWVGQLRPALQAAIAERPAACRLGATARRQVEHAVEARLDLFVQTAQPYLSSSPGEVARLLDRLPAALSAAVPAGIAAGGGAARLAVGEAVQQATARHIADSNLRYVFLPTTARAGIRRDEAVRMPAPMSGDVEVVPGTKTPALR